MLKMEFLLKLLGIFCILWMKQVGGYHQYPKHNLFNWFKSSSPETPISNPIARKESDETRLNELKNSLEKVSNTQKRDYDAEAKAKTLIKTEPKDKQPLSYNYNKANEFPNLYKGWIQSEGDQIARQMISSIKAAILKNERYIEVLFDPVPNLDEVAFGTEWNQRFRKDVVNNLQVPEFATNRGGPATLEWSNIYWANRLAAGIIGNSKKDIVAITLSGEGTRGKYLPILTPGLSLLTQSEVKSPKFSAPNLQAFILLSPCQEEHYRFGKTLGDKYNIPIIALNSPFSFRYDIGKFHDYSLANYNLEFRNNLFSHSLGGGSPYNLAYVMKRIPKGWIYRSYPKAFEAIVEGPNYEIFRVATFPTQPKLTEISAVNMKASADKYGATGNDRIFENRL
jgi:hypothetical protein